MKLLLYCTKAKPYLYPHFHNMYFTKNKDYGDIKLNGKIIAECDFEVEEIEVGEGGNKLITKTLSEHNLLMKSCLDLKDILKYTENINGFGYAIHIKNLHIFDEPYELGKALIYNFDTQYIVEKAPQNMMKVYNRVGECHILISIKPEWLCKILNGEKTIEIRKKVLKEMLE